MSNISSYSRQESKYCRYIFPKMLNYCLNRLFPVDQPHSSCMFTIQPSFTAQPFHSPSSLFVQRWLSNSHMLVGRQMKRQTNSLILFFCFFFSHVRPHKQTKGRHSRPSNTSYLLISSELFSMPAVKRFSVSFARHPTNGMSAFIQVSFDTQFISCMIFLWENISCVSIIIWGLAAFITLNALQIKS